MDISYVSAFAFVQLVAHFQVDACTCPATAMSDLQVARGQNSSSCLFASEWVSHFNVST